MPTSSAPERSAGYSDWQRLAIPYQKPDTVRSLW